MHDVIVARFIGNLLVILLSANLFGELAERWKQPAVLGELLGGVVLGLGFFSFFRPHDPALSLMAQFGVVLLLFETGLESDLSQLLKFGPISLAVACVGVALPFIAGYVAMAVAGHGGIQGVLVGAAMTATSVGITARVLTDLGHLQREEAQIILGAAVIDDILGVVILSVVQGAAAQGHISWTKVGWTAFLASAFVGAALLLGPRLSRLLIKIVERMRSRGALITAAVCFAFGLALLAHAIGTALIVGAFAAGILLAQTERKVDIHTALKPVSDIFVPIFFVMVGAEVDLRHYAPWSPDNWPVLGLAAFLVVVAIATKIVSGWAAVRRKLNHWAIGVGMIPRGEVGLIFTQVGLAAGVIGMPLYAALVGMVIVTTFVAPPMLKRVFYRPAS